MKTFWLLFTVVLLAGAQEALTNDAVVKMVQSGLGEGLVISMIQGQPGKYSLSPDELVKLKNAGVSEKILAAMASKGSGSGSPATPSSATAGDADIPQNIDIGVYYKKNGAWEEMLPEVVNWKTGRAEAHSHGRSRQRRCERAHPGRA